MNNNHPKYVWLQFQLKASAEREHKNPHSNSNVLKMDQRKKSYWIPQNSGQIQLMWTQTEESDCVLSDLPSHLQACVVSCCVVWLTALWSEANRSVKTPPLLLAFDTHQCVFVVKREERPLWIGGVSKSTSVSVFAAQKHLLVNSCVDVRLSRINLIIELV